MESSLKSYSIFVHRLFWTVAWTFAAIPVLPVLYFVFIARDTQITNVLGAYIGICLWTLLWHLLSLKLGSGIYDLYLVGMIILIRLAIDWNGSILRHLEIRPLGFLVMGILPVFAMASVRGWQGALFTAVLAFFLLGQHANPLQKIMGGCILASAGAFGLFVNRLVELLDRAYEELEKAAYYDYLTGFGNRRALLRDFDKYIAISKRQKTPLLLSLWDLDGLKKINDSGGHSAGDRHIRDFSEALRSSLRVEDSIYRTGGDEFVGFHLGSGDGRIIFERVRNLYKSVSAGWIQIEQHSLDEAMHIADRRMYESKNSSPDG